MSESHLSSCSEDSLELNRARVLDKFTERSVKMLSIVLGYTNFPVETLEQIQFLEKMLDGREDELQKFEKQFFIERNIPANFSDPSDKNCAHFELMRIEASNSVPTEQSEATTDRGISDSLCLLEHWVSTLEKTQPFKFGNKGDVLSTDSSDRPCSDHCCISHHPRNSTVCQSYRSRDLSQDTEGDIETGNENGDGFIINMDLVPAKKLIFGRQATKDSTSENASRSDQAMSLLNEVGSLETCQQYRGRMRCEARENIRRIREEMFNTSSTDLDFYLSRNREAAKMYADTRWTKNGIEINDILSKILKRIDELLNVMNLLRRLCYVGITNSKHPNFENMEKIIYTIFSDLITDGSRLDNEKHHQLEMVEAFVINSGRCPDGLADYEIVQQEQDWFEQRISSYANNCEMLPKLTLIKEVFLYKEIVEGAIFMKREEFNINDNRWSEFVYFDELLKAFR